MPAEPMNLRERSITLPTGVTLHVAERAGEGTPVVLLHGVWSWWRRWLPLLEPDGGPFAGRRLLLPDLRGHGESSRTPGDYTLEASASDIVALIERENLSRLMLAGHSLGALLCLLAASRLAGRVEALLLEEPPLPLPAASSSSDLAERWLDFAEGAFELAALKQLAPEAMAAAMMERQPELTEAEATESARCLSLVDDEVFAAVLGNAATAPVIPDDFRLSIPALVIQGGDPARRMLQDAGVAQLRHLLPAMQLVTIPDTGHSVLPENPPAYRAAVQQFVEGGR